MATRGLWEHNPMRTLKRLAALSGVACYFSVGEKVFSVTATTDSLVFRSLDGTTLSTIVVNQGFTAVHEVAAAVWKTKVCVCVSGKDSDGIQLYAAVFTYAVTGSFTKSNDTYRTHTVDPEWSVTSTYCGVSVDWGGDDVDTFACTIQGSIYRPLESRKYRTVHQILTIDKFTGGEYVLYPEIVSDSSVSYSYSNIGVHDDVIYQAYWHSSGLSVFSYNLESSDPYGIVYSASAGKAYVTQLGWCSISPTGGSPTVYHLPTGTSDTTLGAYLGSGTAAAYSRAILIGQDAASSTYWLITNEVDNTWGVYKRASDGTITTRHSIPSPFTYTLLGDTWLYYPWNPITHLADGDLSKPIGLISSRVLMWENPWVDGE